MKPFKLLSIITAAAIGISVAQLPKQAVVTATAAVNEYDYSTKSKSDLSDYKFYRAGYDATTLGTTTHTNSTVDIVQDNSINQKVLRYVSKGNDSNAGKADVLKIPLDNPISTTQNKKFVIEAKVKIPRQNAGNMTRGLFSLSDGNNINIFGLSFLTANEKVAINANNRSDGAWTHKQNTTTNTGWASGSAYNNVGGADGTGGTDSSRKTFMEQSEATSDYYTYRWVVDTQSKTFRFYYSKDGGTGFAEPWGDVYMIDTSKGTDKTDRYSEPGVFPTGNLPSTINSLLIRTVCPSSNANNSHTYVDMTYDIAYIKANELEGDAQLRDGIFVSESGSDSNSGSINSPLKTIESAVDKFWQCKNLYGYSPVIYLREGSHYINKTINLNNSYQGISFRNYNNEKVTLNGAYTGGTVTTATSADLGGHLNSELVAQGKIKKWDISGCNDLEQGGLIDARYQDPELAIDGELQTLARWPESGYAYTTGYMEKIGQDVVNTGTNKKYNYTHKIGITASLEGMDISKARARGYFAWNYRLSTALVKSYDTANKAVELEVHGYLDSEQWMATNRRYYLYNIPDELDTQGEYYIDYDNKCVYYYPEDANAVPQLSILSDGMFKLSNGCDNVSFTGIEFVNTRGTFIDGADCDGLRVNKCIFKNSGGRCVRMVNTYNTHVTESGFYNIGDSAVELTGGDRLNLVPSNSSVKNCYFTNGGRARTYAPFVQAGTTGIEGSCESIGINIENNYFYDHKHTAVIYEGNDIIIKNNIFDKCGTEVQDAAGGVYARIYPTYRGNEITNNIFRNIRSYKLSKEKSHIFAVYMDDLIPGTKIDNNLFYNCEEAINLGGGQAHKFTNNMVYDCYRLGTYIHRGNNKDELKEGGYLRADVLRMRNKGYDQDKWYDRYPDYKQFAEDLDKFIDDPDMDNADNGAMQVRMIDFKGNTMICDNAKTDSAYISGNGGAIFASLKDYNAGYNPPYGVNWQDSSNYYSTDLSKVTVNGTAITKNTSDSFTVPDVDEAGIVSNPLGLPTGREGNNYIYGKNETFFKGYRVEELDRYTNGTSVTATEELEISGSEAISGGKVDLSNGESITVKLPAPANTSLAVGLEMTGTVKVYADGKEAGTLTASTKGFKELVVTPEYEKEISEITLTATAATQIYTIGVSCSADTEGNQKYLSYDFEDVTQTTPVQEYTDKIYHYSVYGYAKAQLQDDGSGNNSLYFSAEHRVNAPNRDEILEFKFTPVKIKDTSLDVSFRIKCLSQELIGENATNQGAYSALQYCMEPYGFNTDEPSVTTRYPMTSNGSRVMVQANRNKGGGNLRCATDTTNIATEAEFMADYIDVKYTLDGVNKKVTYYTKVNGDWKELTECSLTYIPDYIDRLLCKIETDELEKTGLIDISGGCEYLIDDIVVSQDRHILFTDNAGKECDLTAGSTVNVNSDYVAGAGGKAKAFITAIKNADGTLDWCDTSNNNQITIPDRAGETLELYSLMDLINLTPAKNKAKYIIK